MVPLIAARQVGFQIPLPISHPSVAQCFFLNRRWWEELGFDVPLASARQKSFIDLSGAGCSDGNWGGTDGAGEFVEEYEMYAQ